MNIGLAHAEPSSIGGFELLLMRVAGGLEQRGHRVEWIRPRSSEGLTEPPVPHEIRLLGAGLFEYVSQVIAFREAEAEVDVVLSSQPPSQAVTGPPQIALFYHHYRIFYDLADVWIEAGWGDAAAHELCRRAMQRIDRSVYSNVSVFLTGSDTAGRRLSRFGPADVPRRTLRAPLLLKPKLVDKAPERGNPLCVSRSEFPKRTELFVAAMKLLPDAHGDLIGTGGRLGWVTQRDVEWSAMGSEAVSELDPKKIWLAKHDGAETVARAAESNVSFHGWLSDDGLDAAYAKASCIVAPSYAEDYGLTVLEAWARRRPVIVCSDGGGLTETVELAGGGLVVPPDHRALAAAIRQLNEDGDLADDLGERGLEYVSSLTWSDYLDELTNELEAQA